MSSFTDRIAGLNAEDRRAAMDKRNAGRRTQRRVPVVRVVDPLAPVAIPDTDFDDFLERAGW